MIKSSQAYDREPNNILAANVYSSEKADVLFAVHWDKKYRGCEGSYT